MTIYALKADAPDDEDATERHRALVARSPREGFARFGWSYIGTADLQQLTARIERDSWESLSEDERVCYRRFLLEIAPSDFVVYVNVPSWGRCTAAQVAPDDKPYTWLDDRDGIGDFRHGIRVLSESIVECDRNDDRVHPALRARLKLRGRHWQVYAEDEFRRLCEELRSAGGSDTVQATITINHFRDEAEPLFRKLSAVIHRVHPNFDLEALLAEAFARLPGVHVERKRGRADQGADLVLTLESGLPIDGLRHQETCLVQVKSHTGSEWSTRAVENIERALEAYPDATMGLIVTTATDLEPRFEEALSQLQDGSTKPIAVLYGARLAEFILRNSVGLFG